MPSLKNERKEPSCIKTGIMPSGQGWMLQGNEHHLKSQVPVVTGSCQFGSRLLSGYIQVCPYMDIPTVEDMFIDLLGVGVQLQHQGEWDRLTSTVSCEKWRKETSIHLAFFFRQPLDKAGCHRACQGIAWACGSPGTRMMEAPWVSRAGQPQAPGTAPAPGFGTETNPRLSRAHGHDGPGRAGPQGPDTRVT